jgi:phosphatidyl-myo-inositol dimannoside synthase
VGDAKLIIAGDGPQADLLRRTAVDLGIGERVVFSGRIPEEHKVALYNLADVFVSPSSLEGFGFTVAEAMSCGLPVVVARQGALPEIVGDGPGSVVCDVDRYDQFADALVGLLRSPERRMQGGQANRARIDALFRWKEAVRRVREIYVDVVARWRGARPGDSNARMLT